MTELSVATFNVRSWNLTDGAHGWLRRRPATLRQIARLDADVCGLQEVRTAQRCYLEKGLRDTDWCGVGRANGRRRGEQSPILLRRGLLAVTEWRTLWLSPSPGRPGAKGWDAAAPRIATVLQATLDGVPIGILNTHFDHRGRRAQQESGRLVADVVRRGVDGRGVPGPLGFGGALAGARAGGVAGSLPRRWIVMGDFNVAADAPAMRPLLDAGLRHVLPDDAGGTFHAFTGDARRRRIDHILVDDGFEVLGADIVRERPGGILPSDHWPILARLRLRD